MPQRPGSEVRLRLATFLVLVFGGLVAFGIAGPLALAGSDAHAYWSAWVTGQLYDGSGLWNATYVYPPPLAQGLYPATLLPWEAFRLMGMMAATVAYGWLLEPLPRPLWLAAMFALTTPILVGNLEWLIAAAAVVGLSAPVVWAAPILIKVTPGVGLLWFLVRREWRALLTGLTVTVFIGLVSLAIDPLAWARWVSVAREATDQVSNGPPINRYLPLAPRLVAAVIAVVFAARSDKRWLIPIALVLAQPDLTVTTYGLLAAMPRLARRVEPAAVALRRPTMHPAPGARQAAS